MSINNSLISMITQSLGFVSTFPTQESSHGLLNCRWILYQLSYQGSPVILYYVKQRHYCAVAIIVFVVWIFEYGIKMYIDVKQSKWWTVAYNFYTFGASGILKHPYKCDKCLDLFILPLCLKSEMYFPCLSCRHLT